MADLRALLKAVMRDGQIVGSSAGLMAASLDLKMADWRALMKDVMRAGSMDGRLAGLMAAS